MTRASWSERAARESLGAQAAQWFARMQSGNISAQDRAQLSQWLASSPDHVQEYLAVAALWQHLDATADARLSMEQLVADARADRAADNIIELATTSSSSLAPRPPEGRKQSRSTIFFWPIAATVATLAVGVGGWFLADSQLNGRRYSTAVGEQTSFALADGSTVRLNTQSELRARFSRSVREIRLVRGEAMFEVAKDATRPFRVQAGETTVDVLGTVFNVYRAKAETRVTVIEGRVRVEARESSGRAPTEELASAERARVSPEGRIVKERGISADQVKAWTDRRLIFHGETLGTVVEEFNRYNAQRIQVGDPELAQMRISGNFRADDSASLVEFLRRTESVIATHDADGGVQLLRKE